MAKGFDIPLAFMVEVLVAGAVGFFGGIFDETAPPVAAGLEEVVALPGEVLFDGEGPFVLPDGPLVCFP